MKKLLIVLLSVLLAPFASALDDMERDFLEQLKGTKWTWMKNESVKFKTHTYVETNRKKKGSDFRVREVNPYNRTLTLEARKGGAKFLVAFSKDMKTGKMQHPSGKVRNIRIVPAHLQVE